VPPIGAQGLNLGFRDAASLAGLVGDAIARGVDPGAPDLLRAYDHAREPDVASRAVMTDVLNRSLITDMLPVQALRGLGLNALAAIGPLRRFAMQIGMEPPGERPALMRPADR
ncbi:MAG TPA: UbiH/UbiF family hydroxylase, partial [Hyphomicrobiaceae bacterium]|nr:UbiH/UbiF family hydroxylase [Hyphomicrobiaceae bacterium]